MNGNAIKKYLSFAAVLLLIVVFMVACGGSIKQTNEELLQSALAAATGSRTDWQKVRTLAFKAVKQKSEDANAHAMLAIALEQCGQPDNAVDEIRKAVELDPRNFMAQLTKGRILFERDRIGDCIAPLKEAYKLKPDNENVLLLLARSSAKLERYKEAMTYYATLARLPSYKDRPEPYNELAVLYVSQKDNVKASAFFNEAYKKAPTNYIVVLNIGIFCDVYLNNPAYAIKHYNKYQELTLSNRELEPVRIKLTKRIEFLKQKYKL
ncbi:MAG: tetratricopeptide repeat protein [Victivallales bacterium]